MTNCQLVSYQYTPGNRATRYGSQQRISTIAATMMEPAVKSSGQRLLMAVQMRCDTRFRLDASRVESAVLAFAALIITVFPTLHRSHLPKIKNNMKLITNKNKNNTKISDFGPSSASVLKSWCISQIEHQEKQGICTDIVHNRLLAPSGGDGCEKTTFLLVAYCCYPSISLYT